MKKSFNGMKKKKKKTLFSLWREVWVPVVIVVAVLVIQDIATNLHEIRYSNMESFHSIARSLWQVWLPDRQEYQMMGDNEEICRKEELELINLIESFSESGLNDMYIILRDQDGNVLAKSKEPQDNKWSEWDKDYMQSLLDEKESEGDLVGHSLQTGEYGKIERWQYVRNLAIKEARYEISFRLGSNRYTLLIATKDDDNSLAWDYMIKNALKGFIFSLAFSFLLAFYFYRIYKKEIELQKQQRDFSNALAHDLKTPLMAISGYAENLAGNICPDKSGHYIEGIQSNVTYMDHLVGQVLDLAKTEQGVADLKLERIDLSPMVEKILAQYEILVEQKKLAVTIEGDADIQADGVKMERVLENLLRNAITYSPEGNKVSIKLDKQHLEIKNTGVEITEEELKDIWKPFVTGDKSRVRESGHGLGLSIVANILDLHGFRYGIKSEKQMVCVSIFFHEKTGK